MAGVPTIKITGSVGADTKSGKAVNNEKDVKLVRGILKDIAVALADNKYDPGDDLPSLIKAIKAFQKNILLTNLSRKFRPDGNIGTDGSTWKGLRWFHGLPTITLKRNTRLNYDYSLVSSLTVSGTLLYAVEQPYTSTGRWQNRFPSGRWLLCHSWKWHGTSKAALRPAWVGTTGTPNRSLLVHYANSDSSRTLKGCVAPGTEKKSSGNGILNSRIAMNRIFQLLGGYFQGSEAEKGPGWIQGAPGGKVVVLHVQNGIPKKSGRKKKASKKAKATAGKKK